MSNSFFYSDLFNETEMDLSFITVEDIEVNGTLYLKSPSNQIKVGNDDNVTFNIITSGSDRTLTIPDTISDAQFVMTETDQTINGNKTFNDSIVAGRNVTFTNPASSFTVEPATTFNNDVTFNSDITVGSTIVNGNLTVNGDSIMHGNVTITDNGSNSFEVDTGTVFNAPISINADSNHIVIGYDSGPNTVTLNVDNPGFNRIYTVPDVSLDADFVMTEGAQSIAGNKGFVGNIGFTGEVVFSNNVKFTNAINQLAIQPNGTGNILSITTSSPSSNIVHTIPTIGSNANFVMNQSSNLVNSSGALLTLVNGSGIGFSITGSSLTISNTGLLSVGNAGGESLVYVGTGLGAIKGLTAHAPLTLTGLPTTVDIDINDASPTANGVVYGYTDSVTVRTFLGYNAGLNYNPSLPFSQSPIAIGYECMKNAGSSADGVYIGAYCCPKVNNSSNVCVGNKIASNATTFTGTKSVIIGDAALNLVSTYTGVDNVFIGYHSASNITSSSYNVGIGKDTLSNLTTAGGCVAIGNQALLFCTKGGQTAVGYQSAMGLTTGDNIVAVGANTLTNLSSGSNNTAIGTSALNGLQTANNNTAVGYSAGLLLTSPNNTLVGSSAGASLTTGLQTTAVGSQALASGTTCNNACAFGYLSATNLTTGIRNSAFGTQSLQSNLTGQECTALGFSAGLNATGNNGTFVGSQAGVNVTSGNDCIIIGRNAGSNVTTANNVIVIGSGLAAANATGTYIANVYNSPTIVTSQDVFVNSTGLIGTIASSIRYKEDIKDLDSSFIFNLRPVSFRYKEGISEDRNVQMGLIAEEVYNVKPELCVMKQEYDEVDVKHNVSDGEVIEKMKNPKGKPYVHSVRYSQLITPMLNEIIKLRKELDKIKSNLIKYNII